MKKINPRKRRHRPATQTTRAPSPGSKGLAFNTSVSWLDTTPKMIVRAKVVAKGLLDGSKKLLPADELQHKLKAFDWNPGGSRATVNEHRLRATKYAYAFLVLLQQESKTAKKLHQLLCKKHGLKRSGKANAVVRSIFPLSGLSVKRATAFYSERSMTITYLWPQGLTQRSVKLREEKQSELGSNAHCRARISVGYRHDVATHPLFDIQIQRCRAKNMICQRNNVSLKRLFAFVQ